MLMRLIGARAGRPMNRCRVSLCMLRRAVRVSIPIVDPRTMLNAPRMLDQEHVAAVRAL